MPKRIQLSRRKGWRLADHSDNVVIVDRRSKWGNPYCVVGPVRGKWYIEQNYLAEAEYDKKQEAVRDAVIMYRQWLREMVAFGKLDITELTGRDIACWCDLNAPCHGDVLLELANEEAA